MLACFYKQSLPGIIEVGHVLPPISFFGDMYELIKLYVQTNHISNELDIHEKLIETITTSIFYSRFKVDNENDMAAHAICF